MNKICIAILLVFLMESLNSHAQYTSENSFMRTALVLYHKNAKGFFEPSENVMVDAIDNVTSVYAYDKKAHNLYVRNNHGNFVVTLNNEYAKIVKNNKQIPQLTQEVISSLAQNVNDELHQLYARKNDSIRVLEQKARTKAINDSLELARVAQEKENAVKRKKEQLEKEFSTYRNMASYSLVPLDGITLKCADCGQYFCKDYVVTEAIKHDSIYFITSVTKELQDEYVAFHVAPVPKVLKTDPNFMFHVKAFADSLCNDTVYSLSYVNEMNQFAEANHYRKILNLAPYGFFNDWGWGNDYSFLTFNFSFTNLGKKTIKYIDVYWKVTNDVGDLRKVGHFKGTGPVAQYETASWDWDSSSYYVAGDASNMQITKAIITYMNGSQKTLSGKLLQFNSTSDYVDEMSSDDPRSSYGSFVSEYYTNDNCIVDSPAMYSEGSVQLYVDVHQNLLYTPSLSKDHKQARVVLKMEINKDGTIGDVVVEKSDNSQFDNIAKNAAAKLGKFIPAEDNGKKVKVWFRLPVIFYF